jgi:ribosome biogenesis GTPase
VIVLTKRDLVQEPAPELVKVETIAFGVPVLRVSTVTGEGVGEVRAALGRGRTGALLGSSGVGKSSLVNTLLGADVQVVREIRSDGRGRHTTTHRELFLLPGGGLVLDTPGMRTLRLQGAADGIAETFEDVETLAARCRFAGCAHAVSLGAPWRPRS